MWRFAYDCGAFLSLVLCGALFAVEEPPAYQQTDAKDQKHGSQPIGGTGLDQGHGRGVLRGRFLRLGQRRGCVSLSRFLRRQLAGGLCFLGFLCFLCFLGDLGFLRLLGGLRPLRLLGDLGGLRGLRGLRVYGNDRNIGVVRAVLQVGKDDLGGVVLGHNAGLCRVEIQQGPAVLSGFGDGIADACGQVRERDALAAFQGEGCLAVFERDTAPFVVDRGDGIIVQRELKGERGVIVARQQFPERLFADGQAADAAVCGLEGQGAGVRIDGCDENYVQIRFVPVGVPAGGFIVVIPAGNEIIAVRFAIQLPAAAGGAKGNGGSRHRSRCRHRLLLHGCCTAARHPKELLRHSFGDRRRSHTNR